MHLYIIELQIGDNINDVVPEFIIFNTTDINDTQRIMIYKNQRSYCYGITASNTSEVINSAAEVINSAVYDASTGNLVLTGMNFNASSTIDVTLTITGQGGSTYTLTSATSNPTPVNTTSATVVMSEADQTAVNMILTKDGTTAPDSNIYNITAAMGWRIGAATSSNSRCNGRQRCASNKQCDVRRINWQFGVNRDEL